MQENEIVSKYITKTSKKRNYRKTLSKITHPDLIKRNWRLSTGEYQILYTDITCLKLNGQTYFQSTIINAFSMKIVDYKISDQNSNIFVMENLRSAINKIKSEGVDTKGIIIHSDKGFQYTQ